MLLKYEEWMIWEKIILFIYIILYIHSLSFFFSQNLPIIQGKCESLSCVQLFDNTWIAAPQAPLSMEFSRQEYWSGLPFPPPGDPPPTTGTELRSSALQADSLPPEPQHLLPLRRAYKWRAEGQHWDGEPRKRHRLINGRTPASHGDSQLGGIAKVLFYSFPHVLYFWWHVLHF